MTVRALQPRSPLRRLRDGSRLIRPFFWSLGAAHRLQPAFAGVTRYCMFIGYPRSGHSLVGALLNAHPRMVIAHELDALRYVVRPFTRAQLFALILRRDREFVAQGTRWTGYDYSVPQSAQGIADGIQVIGDKKGGRSSLRIAADPEILGRLERMVGPGLRIIHVTRNPFDIIATMVKRGRAETAERVHQFERHCAGSALALSFAGPDRAITVAHEDLVLDPRATIHTLCEFLGQDAPEPYIEQCAARIFKVSRKTRKSVIWHAEDVAAVSALIGRYPFLRRYAADLPEQASG